MKRTIIALLFASITASSVSMAAPVQWASNGHYYDFITGTLTWDEAKTASEALSYMGLSGYLVTITSSGENDFINSTFNTGNIDEVAHIGAWEPNDDGVWKWATGPEAGTQFSNYAVPTSPYNYANWGGVEPNDGGGTGVTEDYAVFNIGASFNGISPSGWADGPGYYSLLPVETPVVGYIIEYSIVPEPISSILFVTGGTLLAGRRYLRRKKIA